MNVSVLSSIIASRVERSVLPFDVERIVGDVLAIAREHSIDIPSELIRTLVIHGIRREVNHATNTGRERYAAGPAAFSGANVL